MDSSTIRKEISRTLFQGTLFYGPLGGLGGWIVQKAGGQSSVVAGCIMMGLQPTINKIIEVILRKTTFKEKEKYDIPTFTIQHVVSWGVSAWISNLVTKNISLPSCIVIQVGIIGMVALTALMLNRREEHLVEKGKKAANGFYGYDEEWRDYVSHIKDVNRLNKIFIPVHLSSDHYYEQPDLDYGAMNYQGVAGP